MVSIAVVPHHIDEIFLAIFIMEQGRGKAGAVYMDGFRPVAINGIAGNKVVVAVLPFPSVTFTTV
jgi:hypothetical protein